MKYKEFSIESLLDESRRLAACIPVSHRPDIVVFIARGGLIIGQGIADVFGVPLCAVKAERKGNRLKEIMTPLLEHLPKRVCIWLRSREVGSGIHKSRMERDIRFLEPIPSARRVLLVDDSVDTGISALQVRDALQFRLSEAIIELAALNVFRSSESNIHTDYALYYDTLVNTPASADSPEHHEFLRRWSAYEHSISSIQRRTSQTERIELSIDQIRRIEYDMLTTLADFCDAHGLTYYLSGGTLLGAVRHQGFIPWDDDIDVMMPREDYMTFLHTFEAPHITVKSAALGDAIPAHACLFDTRTKLTYTDGTPFYFPSVFIDIFPIDGWGNGLWKAKARCWVKELFIYIHQGATLPFHPSKRYLDRTGRFLGIRTKVRTVVKYAFITVFRATSARFWARMLDRISQAEPMENSKYAGVYLTPSHNNHGLGEMIPAEAWQGKVKVPFEGRDFWAPVGWKQYLTSLYGDYMTPPPPDKQVPHHDFRACWIADDPFPYE